jgi:hypothetical protein
MHTAFSLNSEMFGVELDGRKISREALLDWQLYDRLGVVVTSPLGALGASLLMQLTITAYYDIRPARRTGPHYAEIYLFHAGGRFGDFSNFDLSPMRKEVFLSADSGDLIEAINDRAVTHLVVPDTDSRPLAFPWKEAEAARDRIRRCFAYDPSGRTAHADVVIRALNAGPLDDIESTLDAQRVLNLIPESLAVGTPAEREFNLRWAARFRRRVTEISAADRATARRRREAISHEGLPRELYRRISTDQALGMLHP